MYYIRDISVHFGERPLLKKVSFMVSPRDRVGLIGRNGAGKSTLLKIIAGLMIPDSGKIELPTNTTVGYLKQEFELNESLTVMNETMSCHDEAMALHTNLTAANVALAERTDFDTDSYKRLIAQVSEWSAQLEHFNLKSLEVETIKILKGLGFKESELHNQVSTFSGGWKMRIELAKLLLRNPDIMLLDEPTNHLDIESILWLEQYLLGYTGTIILVSHDIQFLENVCNRIIEIDLGSISDYKLSYAHYLEEKLKQKSIQQAAFENQQREIAQKEKTINRFMAKATKTKMAQSMQQQLDKIERIEIAPENTKQMQIRFAEVPRSGREVLTATDVSKSFDSKTVFSHLDLTVERGDRLAFVGQNGQGKTTFAKILCGLLPPSAGTVREGSNVHISFYAQNQSELLDINKTILQVMEDKAPEEMRTKIRSILGSFLFSGEDTDKKIVVLSGGERARLAMASLIMRPCNVLILDEPTNHLDIQSKEVLKSALNLYEGTLIIVSHDRDFLAGLTDKVVEFKDGSIQTYLGDINYFLDKRQMDNMREVALQKSALTTTDAVGTSQTTHLSGEELRRLKKSIQSIEKDIAKLESQLSTLHKTMNEPDFYNTPNHLQVLQQYSDLESALLSKMEEWESLSERLDA